MKDRRSTEELLEIVGPGRASHPAEAVSTAEAELRLRTGTEQELFTPNATRRCALFNYSWDLMVHSGLSIPLAARSSA
jgi:hypothetical protein